MDSLAFLCGSHGDGPSLLRRLHDVGCGCRDDIVRLDVDELARALGWSREAAEQFQRAARELSLSDVELTPSSQPHMRASTPLRPDLVEGLDLAACVALREFGVENLEDLATVEALEMSRAMECSVTRVMRLQAQARRLLGKHLGVHASEHDDVLQPIARRPLTPHPPRFSPAERGAPTVESSLARDLEVWGANGSSTRPR